jgi:hypothetical protein
MFLLNHRNKNKHCWAGYKNAFALKRRRFMWHIESTARSLTALEEHSQSNDTYKPPPSEGRKENGARKLPVQNKYVFSKQVWGI